MLKRILTIIYPRRCVLCRSAVTPAQTAERDLCHACEKDLSLVQQACFQCGIALTGTHEKQLCGQCLQTKPFYDQVISIYHYQNPMIWLIQQMKFHNKILYAHLLAQLMTKHLIERQRKHQLPLPDVIIPVPLHYQRRFHRGFNQAEELSKHIAKHLNCPLDTRFVQRPVNSAQQSGLDAKLRKKNVKGIFSLSRAQQKRYQHVAIIDDVMSTGSTVNEVARLLKKNGIKKVDVWVLARASRD